MYLLSLPSPLLGHEDVYILVNLSTVLQEAPAHDWSWYTDDTYWLYAHTFPICPSYFARVTLLNQRSTVVAEFSEGLQYFH